MIHIQKNLKTYPSDTLPNKLNKETEALDKAVQDKAESDKTEQEKVESEKAEQKKYALLAWCKKINEEGEYTEEEIREARDRPHFEHSKNPMPKNGNFGL